MRLEDYLQEAVEMGASDLHLSAGVPATFRVDGGLVTSSSDVLTNEDVVRLVHESMDENQRKHWADNYECDHSYEVTGLSRFRVNAFKQVRGAAAAFRVVPSRVFSLEELNAPGVFRRIAENRNGLVLVTGPTGSGKSTTLAAMINHINQTKADHILTIEDPIEFVHHPLRSLINQRELGAQTHSFANALRSSLREDPDVILIGEMRDLETIQLALTAAETGHLVFATLHTNSAPKTVDRIIDAFPAADKELVRVMLSESLRAVISQTLLKKPAGGRVAAHEIMICTPSIRNLIREGKVAQMVSAIQTGGEHSMQTMEQAVKKLLMQGAITADTASYMLGQSR